MSAYRLAWIWLRDNYDPDRHMLQVFAPGRGNYAYITKEREWQQNVGFFGKALMAEDTLMRVLAAEKVTSFPAQPQSAGRGAIRVLPPRRSSRRRVAGAPGSVAFRAADHERHQAGRRRLSAGAAWPSRIHGSRGTDRSGRRVVLRDWRTARRLAATDGADEIVPGADGRSLRATWRRFAIVGDKTGN